MSKLNPSTMASSHSIRLFQRLLIALLYLNKLYAFNVESVQNEVFLKQLSANDKINILNNARSLIEESDTSEAVCPICGRSGIPLISNNIVAEIYTCLQLQNEYESIMDQVEQYWYDATLSRCHRFQDLYEKSCCNANSLALPYYECEKNVQSFILPDSYNTAIAPIEKDHYVVNTLIDIYVVDNIDIVTSTASIFIEAFLSWNDPRLAWNVSSDNCATWTTVRASLDPELTSIWVPDLDLANRKEGVRTFPESVAKVYPDGTVNWRRGGKLGAFCSFIGLRRMPFDTIGCEFIFSSSSPGMVINLAHIGDDDDRQRGIRFPSYTQTYTEYRISKEMTGSRYIYNGFTLEVFFKRRAKSYYIFLIITPTILYVFLGFGQFFLDSRSGDRLSLSVTTLLIVVAGNIITSSLLPICEEQLWLNMLCNGSMFFVVICVFETLILYWVNSGEKESHNEVENVKTSLSPSGSYGDKSAVSENELVSNESRHLLRKRNLRTFTPCIKKLRLKLANISVWVDLVAMCVIPFTFVLFLIILYACNKDMDDNKRDIWYSYSLD